MRRIGLLFLVLLVPARSVSAQDDRREYPSLVSRGFLELGVGRISYPFSEAHLEPGHRAGSIKIPRTSMRLVFGYRFDDYLSAQVTYLRPLQWVRYENIDGTTAGSSVWMNVTGLTLKARAPVNNDWSVYGEAGLGVVTRHGIHVGPSVIIKDAVYATPLIGAGADYRIDREWGVGLGAVYSPARSTPAQPKTVALSGGFTYTVNPVVARGPRDDEEPARIFPQHLVQLGYTTNALGYGFNTAVSPVFWQGDVSVQRGVTAHYQRNVFHTRSLFSLDWGASIAYKVSREHRDKFLALSIFPLFRFTVLRREMADLYISYSLAGPTFISKPVIDGQRTGKRFTFQDLMGVGIYTGKDRHINVELRVGHYSNGNLIPQNPGIKVPLTFNVGYAFSDR